MATPSMRTPGRRDRRTMAVIAAAETAGGAAAKLLRPMGQNGRSAIWAYRAAVHDAVERAGRPVELAHDQGQTQIGLRVDGAPELLIIWRIDTGWYYLDAKLGTPLVAPTRYYVPPRHDGPTHDDGAADPIERLLPVASEVATWIVELADGRRTGTTLPPPPISATLALALRNRLSGLLPGLLPADGAAVRYFDVDPRP
ncbi:hypothetical protein [Pseudonocardia sp. GCM10023141]|uniref:hypothetical protein n=1 Tax=Pseudonocardia sp. GCM10023141 TaxID=3252653 RepID=UPI003607904B